MFSAGIVDTSDVQPCAHIGDLVSAKNLSALQTDITAFRDYIAAERGMAKNTVLAYQRDLVKYRDWITTGALANYLTPSVRELTNYLGYLKEQGLAAAVGGRRNPDRDRTLFTALPASRRTVAPNTVELLSSPKLWERIPQVLSLQRRRNLLNAPQ